MPACHCGQCTCHLESPHAIVPFVARVRSVANHGDRVARCRVARCARASCQRSWPFTRTPCLCTAKPGLVDAAKCGRFGAYLKIEHAFKRSGIVYLYLYVAFVLVPSRALRQKIPTNLISRLARGEKVKLTQVEMRRLNQRLYSRTPEVIKARELVRVCVWQWRVVISTIESRCVTLLSHASPRCVSRCLPLCQSHAPSGQCPRTGARSEKGHQRNGSGVSFGHDLFSIFAFVMKNDLIDFITLCYVRIACMLCAL